MPVLNRNKSNEENAADIIRDAGGQIVGRTRLQKMAYLLEITDLGCGFSFEYRHYGPFSEELANAIEEAKFWDLITEEEHIALWGGSYSIYKAAASAPLSGIDPARIELIQNAKDANPIELELAATAAFLKVVENDPDPWSETKRRKPEKAEKFLANAQVLYEKLRSVKTPKPLPAI
jgi:uncharacterized protein YwgA